MGVGGELGGHLAVGVVALVAGLVVVGDRESRIGVGIGVAALVLVRVEVDEELVERVRSRDTNEIIRIETRCELGGVAVEVTVAVGHAGGIERIGAGQFLFTIGVEVAVGVGIVRVGAVGDLVAVVAAVIVGIRIAGIGEFSGRAGGGA